MVKNPPANVGDSGDVGSIPGSERSPRGGNGNPLQYSCLKNPMDRGAWVHRRVDMPEHSMHVLFTSAFILCVSISRSPFLTVTPVITGGLRAHPTYFIIT